MLPKFILQELTREHASVVRLFMIVGCYYAIASLVGFIQTFLQHFIYPRMTYLRIRYIADAFNKVIRADYPYMEDSDFMADTSRTLQAVSANHTGVEEVYHQLFLAPAELFTTIGFIFLRNYQMRSIQGKSPLLARLKR